MDTPFGSGVVVISKNEAVIHAKPTAKQADPPHPSAHALQKLFALKYVTGSYVAFNNCDHTNDRKLPDMKCNLSLVHS